MKISFEIVITLLINFSPVAEVKCQELIKE